MSEQMSHLTAAETLLVMDRIFKLNAEIDRLQADNEQLRTDLAAIAAFGSVNMAGEWPHGLRDTIRSMTDRAKAALAKDTKP